MVLWADKHGLDGGFGVRSVATSGRKLTEPPQALQLAAPLTLTSRENLRRCVAVALNLRQKSATAEFPGYAMRGELRANSDG